MDLTGDRGGPTDVTRTGSRDMGGATDVDAVVGREDVLPLALGRGQRTLPAASAVDLRVLDPADHRAGRQPQLARDSVWRLPRLLAQPDHLGLVFGREAPSFLFRFSGHGSSHPFSSDLSKKRGQLHNARARSKRTSARVL
jgi:hypothetical protein